MKYSLQNIVSQYTRPSTYTPTPYTSTYHTPKNYSTSSYSPSYYSSTKYTPSPYTPPAYTPAYKSTSSSHKSTYSKPSRHVSNPGTPVQQIPIATGKSSRTVRFTNDVIFQDYVRHGELEMIGRFMRARKVRVDTIFHSGMAALHEAVLSGNLECVKLLIKNMEPMFIKEMRMAGHLCTWPAAMDTLRLQGASAEAVNANGEKPVDLIDPDCKELVKLFEVGCV
ncbi:Protein phosphatase 1 regulatory subunit 27 [Bagarius yarrelli]|uniref:Protein phosphatase 1 regulatory subunit 27 n=1 Tax=Bagarius yarrelli TaxID=175774 RepID=A0A556TVV9_BAGYA|nr:Protein phosphatase 1 regulatory subunit 27 [Bagarius yarrelli]